MQTGTVPPAVAEQAAAARRGREGREGDAAPHGAGRDPAPRAGPFGSDTVRAVGSFEVVSEVVDQVGVDLHEERESEAEECGAGAKGVGGAGQGAAQKYGHGGRRERLGPCGQQPGPERSGGRCGGGVRRHGVRYHSIGVRPMLRRYSLACEKWRQPKNPR